LLTQDKDFGELVYRLKKAHNGVVLFRLPGIIPSQKALIADQVVSVYGHQLPGAFVVVHKDLVKVRRP
jgi:hypothetical protein